MSMLNQHISVLSSVWRAGGGAPGPVLMLSATTIAEDAPIGSVVGTLSVSNLPDGVTVTGYTITDDPDNKFVIDDDALETDAALDYETAPSHSVTIEATLSGGDPVSRTATITVTNVFEQPDLVALTLDADEIVSGSDEDTVVGAIVGATGGSTLSLIDDAGGRFALDGFNIVAGATATDYDTATSHNITLRETLADSSNSPRDSVVTITVTDSGEGSMLDLGAKLKFWGQISNLTSLYADTAGTTPITGHNQTVARINDSAGATGPWTQALSGSRGYYQTDGSLHWLLLDKTDDYYDFSAMASLTSAQIIIGMETSDDIWMVLSGGLGPPFVLMAQDGSSSSPYGSAGAATTRVNGVPLEYETRDALHAATAGQGKVVVTASGVLGTALTRFSGYTGYRLGGKFYEIVVANGLNSDELSFAEGLVANSMGISI